MNNINKNKLLLIIIFLSLAFVSLILYNIRYKENDEEIVQNSENNYILLNDYSRFFTVNSCVYRYIVYLQNKDTKSLLQVLDKEYINQNLINENNIYDNIGTLNGNYTFVTKKIYYEKLNDTNIKYYVKGEMLFENIDKKGSVSEKYFIVILDIENQLFSIRPYGGKIFQEEIN